jgi:biopolymer transport protein ExbB
MGTTGSRFIDEAIHIWISGGWLMLPLFLLTIFIYYSVLDLLLTLQNHYLLRARVNHLTDQQIENDQSSLMQQAREVLLLDASSAQEVNRHFVEVRSEYLPLINRRIRFLGITITAGPLIGLLGTVTGMLTAFNGMIIQEGDKLQNVASGISEALITTQVGLVISIPAYIVLMMIIQRRNRLEHCIARLEQYNIRMVLRQTRASEGVGV